MADYQFAFGENNMGVGTQDRQPMGWNSGGSNPTEVRATKDMSKNIFIIGYIAGRKNALSSDIDLDQAKKFFEQAKSNLLKDNVGKIDKINVKGEVIGQIEIAPKLKYNKTNLRSMDKSGYDTASDGVYKVDDKEARPEYIVVALKNRLNKGITESDNELVESELIDNARAYNENSSILLIKEKELVVQLLSAKIRTIDCGALGADGELDVMGTSAPIMRESKSISATGPKFITRFNHYKIDKNTGNEPSKISKVKNLGYMGIPYAVNRDYTGDRPSNVRLITNQERMEQIFPNLDVNSLGLTKPSVKTGDDEVPMRVREEIPYSQYADAYSKMRVTEEMLQKIRTSGSARTDFSIARLDKDFRKSLEIFELFLNSKSK